MVDTVRMVAASESQQHSQTDLTACRHQSLGCRDRIKVLSLFTKSLRLVGRRTCEWLEFSEQIGPLVETRSFPLQNGPLPNDTGSRCSEFCQPAFYAVSLNCLDVVATRRDRHLRAGTKLRRCNDDAVLCSLELNVGVKPFDDNLLDLVLGVVSEFGK